jgi:hypothetical protein
MGAEQFRPFDKLRAAPSSVEGPRQRQRCAGTGGYSKDSRRLTMKGSVL